MEIYVRCMKQTLFAPPPRNTHNFAKIDKNSELLNGKFKLARRTEGFGFVLASH